MVEFFKNLRISVKLIISAVVFVIAFGFVAIVGVTGLKKINNTNLDIHNQQIFINDATHKLINTTGMLSLEISSYASGTSNAEVLKSKVVELKKLTEELVTGSSTSGIDDELKNEFRGLSIIANELYTNSQDINLQSAENISQSGKTAALISSLKKYNTKFSNIMLIQNKLAGNSAGLIEDVRKQMVKRTIFWTSVLFFIAALLYGLTIRNIRISIQKTLRFTEKLAEGDLTAITDLHTRDEIGMINESLESLREKFKEVLNSLKDVSQSIEVASNEFRSGSEVISEGANHQAAASAEISSTIEEISTMLRQLSVDAKETDRIATVAYNGIQKGAESVDNALTTIEEIAAKNSAISEISYQTKILSINASVEAARAAEYGRGFAVVAEEVKRLAESSQQSASDIKKVSKKGVQITKDSANELRNIVTEFQKTSELINKIAMAGEEHVISLDQIISTIHELNNTIQQNASSSEELTASSEELVRLSETLNNTISFFKLEENLEIPDEDFSQTETEDKVKETGEEDNFYSGQLYTTLASQPERPVIQREYYHFVSKEEEDPIEEKFEDDIPVAKEHTAEEKIETISEPEVEDRKEISEEPEPIKKTTRRVSKTINTNDIKGHKKGVRINLTDNDDLDNQFEKMK